MYIHQPALKQINFLDERFYTRDEVTYYPSVTTVLDIYPKGYGFLQWLKDLGNNADEVMRRAGDSGTRVHTAIESYLKGQEVYWVFDGKEQYQLEEWKMILKFKDFWTTYVPELIVSEAKVVSDLYRLGGTIDIVCNIGGTVWLLDAKTSNAIHPSHELQLSAYAMMWNEEHPDMKIKRTGIVWLKALTRGADKAGKKIQGHGWQIKEWERSYQSAYKVFEHCRAIWDEENPDYRPQNVVLPDRIKLGQTEKVEQPQWQQ